jgi:hypothetical protein
MYKYLDSKGEHRHEFDGKPLLGTSSVIGVLMKVLTWWASGQAVGKLGWVSAKENTPEARNSSATKSLEEIKGMTPEAYLKLLDEAYKAHSVKLKTSATAGTDLHQLLESYVKMCMEEEGVRLTNTDNPYVIAFSEWAVENVEKFLWSEGNVYSERMWTGGIFDAMCKLKDGKICLLDFKSAKEAYESHFYQISGYDIQQSENGAFTPDGKQVLKPQKIDAYYVFPFGAKKFKPEVRYNTKELRDIFEACLLVYRYQNK